MQRDRVTTTNRKCHRMFVPTAWLAFLALFALAPAGPPVRANEIGAKGSRGVLVEDLRNERAPFLVRVDVDRPDRTYRGGDTMTVKVTSEEEGYLYLLYLSADDKLSCLFPNQVQSDNRIPARQQITVPAPQAQFRLRVGPPFGQEVLKAIVTKTAIDPTRLGVESLTKGPVTPLESEKFKAVAVELDRDRNRWAEHHVQITTVSPVAAVKPEPPKPRRVGLFIGISEYRENGIRNLRVCHRDAQEMARVMREHCRLDEAVVLVNQQATLSAIRKAFMETLVKKTKPGDKVFIFWSGHGGRCADDTGNEPDGHSEFLVPYDAGIGDLATLRRTMLMDRTFGRWVQELDGRRVIVMIDTCHSGGQAAGQKGFGLPSDQDAGQFANNFMEAILTRAKNIGQEEAAVLAASQAAQIAFERREGDLSVMTYFLARQLEQADSGVTLQAAYEHLKREVPAYVEKRFPGITQTPVLADQTTPPVYLRP